MVEPLDRLRIVTYDSEGHLEGYSRLADDPDGRAILAALRSGEGEPPLATSIEAQLDDLARDLAGPLGTDARLERIRSELPSAFREYRDWGIAVGRASVRAAIERLLPYFPNGYVKQEVERALGEEFALDIEKSVIPDSLVREVIDATIGLTKPETPASLNVERLHHSPRCPAKWRCRLPLRGERRSSHVSYATADERAADIAAHYEVYSGTAAQLRAALTPATEEPKP
jgi:hypothetical protein